ncbi:MAG: hypothetical protein CL912_29395 [Deltaproteobacteria bacterium]|nr:hypothetical protein [Deltaproteobacteria bacterium]
MHLQTKIQQTEGNILVDPTYTCDYFDPILHRLLSLPRQDLSSSNASIAEMIRLGAILYLIAVRQSFGIYPIRVKIQIRKLSVLLISFEDSETKDRTWDKHGLGWMELWVNTLGGVLNDEIDEAPFFAKHLHDAMHRMAVMTYGDLEDRLREFAWINEIHGALLTDFRRKLIH